MTPWSHAEAKRTPEEIKQRTQDDKEFEKRSDTDIEDVAGDTPQVEILEILLLPNHRR